MIAVGKIWNYRIHILLHFGQMPYTSMRCPFGLNLVAAETLSDISFAVGSSKSSMFPVLAIKLNEVNVGSNLAALGKSF
jgi:hypothetical protein